MRLVRKIWRVVGLSCDIFAQQEKSTIGMLGASLKQLISRGGGPGAYAGGSSKGQRRLSLSGASVGSLGLPDIVQTNFPKPNKCIRRKPKLTGKENQPNPKRTSGKEIPQGPRSCQPIAQLDCRQLW